MNRIGLILLALWALAGLGCAALPNERGLPALPTGARVALTFDDGPSARWTSHILDILRRERVPASFFVVGDNVERHPELTCRILDEGHVIGNHTQQHLYTITMQPGTTLAREMRAGAATIERVTGRHPRLMRWPVGVVAGNGERATRAATRDGYVHVSHSGHVFDAGGIPTAERITEAALSHAEDGAIIALHDGHSNYERTDQSATVAALPAIIAGLRKRGLRMVTIAELLGERPYR